MFRVISNMFFYKTGNVKVAVVIAFAQAIIERMTVIHTDLLQQLGLQLLLDKIISTHPDRPAEESECQSPEEIAAISAQLS